MPLFPVFRYVSTALQTAYPQKVWMGNKSVDFSLTLEIMTLMKLFCIVKLLDHFVCFQP